MFVDLVLGVGHHARRYAHFLLPVGLTQTPSHLTLAATILSNSRLVLAFASDKSRQIYTGAANNSVVCAATARRAVPLPEHLHQPKGVVRPEQRHFDLAGARLSCSEYFKGPFCTKTTSSDVARFATSPRCTILLFMTDANLYKSSTLQCRYKGDLLSRAIFVSNNLFRSA